MNKILLLILVTAILSIGSSFKTITLEKMKVSSQIDTDALTVRRECKSGWTLVSISRRNYCCKDGSKNDPHKDWNLI